MPLPGPPSLLPVLRPQVWQGDRAQKPVRKKEQNISYNSNTQGPLF